MTLPVIHRVTRLDLRFRPQPWPFADARRADIDVHFAAKKRAKPIWNGRILLARDPVFADGCFSAAYFEADFASFLAWRDWGFPDQAVFNGFGMGALRCSDGAFIMGEMGPHTANAGREFWAQQARICSFVCQSAHRGQPDVDGTWRQQPLFEMDPITRNDCLVEGEPGLRAIPADEIVDGTPIAPL